MNLVEIANLTKKFQVNNVETTALRDVDFTMSRGDFTAITGESGSGKSTLMNIIGMLDQATSGDYYFDGKNVSQMRASQAADFRKGRVGFIFQNFNLLNRLTVFENIELPLKYNGIPKRKRQELVVATADKLGIAHRLSHTPDVLSGGQQQRVACARALVCGTDLILADEPTGNLDKSTGKAVLELLQEVNDQGTAVLLITHSTNHASYAKKQLVMSDGELR